MAKIIPSEFKPIVGSSFETHYKSSLTAFVNTSGTTSTAFKLKFFEYGLDSLLQDFQWHTTDDFISILQSATPPSADALSRLPSLMDMDDDLLKLIVVLYIIRLRKGEVWKNYFGSASGKRGAISRRDNYMNGELLPNEV